MKKIAIIGAGAAGLICAISLKEELPESNIVLIEAKSRFGKKILQTGNGKCNLANQHLTPEAYNHPAFVEKCLAKISIEQCIDFFTKRGLMIRTDEAGRIYPYSETATTMIGFFQQLLDRLQIEQIYDFQVNRIIKQGKKYLIQSEFQDKEADLVVLAMGSNAHSKEDGYSIVRDLGLALTPLQPGLVPLKTKRSLAHLQGIRIKCSAKIVSDRGSFSEQGEILFKSTGLSGILTMDLSRYYAPGAIVTLDLLPHLSMKEWEEYVFEALKIMSIENVLLGIFPKMLVQEILQREGNPMEIAKKCTFAIAGPMPLDQAQIVLGGMNLDEISEFFEIKKYSNMYAIGEMLDIDGACGGYNLSFAWISGLICAKAIKTKMTSL